MSSSRDSNQGPSQTLPSCTLILLLLLGATDEAVPAVLFVVLGLFGGGCGRDRDCLKPEKIVAMTCTSSHLSAAVFLLLFLCIGCLIPSFFGVPSSCVPSSMSTGFLCLATLDFWSVEQYIYAAIFKVLTRFPYFLEPLVLLHPKYEHHNDNHLAVWLTLNIVKLVHAKPVFLNFPNVLPSSLLPYPSFFHTFYSISIRYLKSSKAHTIRL